MKRKWIAGLLTAAMVSAALIGCGGNKEPVGTDTGTEAAGMKESAESSTAQSTDVSDLSGQEEYVCKIVCVGDATSESCEKVAEAASEITMAFKLRQFC